MSVKGWIEANNYRGGIIRYLYDTLKALDGSASTEASKVTALETAVGDEDTEATILYRIKALEDAVGDEDTEATILYRIKALEDAD